MAPKLNVQPSMNKDQQPVDLLALANARATENNLTYAGALTPAETWSLLLSDANAVMVDVRTQAESDWVGFVDLSEDRYFHIEWNRYPAGTRNTEFLSELESRVTDKSTTIVFLCRSGVRSHHAATLAQSAGYTNALNILEGFEGDKNENAHRSTINGWRKAGLPWRQN